MSQILEFKNVRREYKRGIPVLNELSFSVGAGEVIGLLGPNGAGKTTLIRLAMGMLFPHAGVVHVFGLSPTERPVEVKRRIGYVAEEQILPAASTVKELLTFHRYLFPQWDGGLERQLLEQFDLPLNRKIVHMSKGQARQAALICAICHRPELLILDEPGGGLDPAARRDFLEASIQLLNREGTTILFSSHHMGDIERIGGRVILLTEGRVRLDSELDRIREDMCLAIVPASAVPDVEAIDRIPGCLHTRLVFDDWHAVFEGSPELVTDRISESLGTNGIGCMRLPLEELFIEMVGSQRPRRPQ